MRISYLSAVCKRYDAISNAVSQEIGWLTHEGHDVRLFAHACNQPGVPYTRVRTVSDVVLHPFFQTSDLIVCHFGIYFELFDAILAANTKAKILVVFHNITPKDFVAPDQHALIDRSFAQMANMQHADRILCVSDTNLEVLRSQGIQTPAQVLPLAVPGTWQAPPQKPSQQDGVIRLLFVGRFVRSKGLTDLLQAVSLLLQDASPDLPCLTLSLVGNMAFSDTAVVEEVQRHAAQLQAEYTGRIAIHMHFGIDDPTKRQMLANADIFVLPTYHEGFCVPIVEAISSGCRVVAYDNSNVPSISRGLAELVPTGRADVLAQRLAKILGPENIGHQAHAHYENYRQEARHYAEIYSETRIRADFLSQVTELRTM